MNNAITELLKESRDMERQLGIQILIQTCRDFNIPDDQIFQKIVSAYSLSEDEAQKYMENYQD